MINLDLQSKRFLIVLSFAVASTYVMVALTSSESYGLSIPGISDFTGELDLGKLNTLTGIDLPENADRKSGISITDACKEIEHSINILRAKLVDLESQLQAVPANQQGGLMESIRWVKAQISDAKELLRECEKRPNAILDPTVESLDYDTGDLSQWKCTEEKSSNNVLEVKDQSSQPVIQGSHSLKANLKEDADIVFGGERAEVYYCDESHNIQPFNENSRNDIWLHWYTMIPSDGFPNPALIDGDTFSYFFTQIHSKEDAFADYNVPFIFGLSQQNDNTGNTQVSKMFIRERGNVYDKTLEDADPSNDCSTPSTGGYYVPGCGFLWAEDLQKDHWYEVWVHIIWSIHSDGLFEGTVDGNQITEYHGPTLDPLDPDYREMYLKQGFYRDSEINVDQTVYNDGTELISCPSGYSFNLDTVKCVQ